MSGIKDDFDHLGEKNVIFNENLWRKVTVNPVFSILHSIQL